MKLDKVVFGLVLAMWGVVILTMLMPEVEGAYGVVHPEFPSMRHGGAGRERHEPLLWLSWAFGVLMILMCVALIAFGARQHERLRGAGRPLIYAAAANLGAWTWMIVSYQKYIGDAAHPLILAFPAPTAIMLYVFFPLSLIFNLYFVAGFRRWVLTDEDYERFRRLLADKRQDDSSLRDGRAGTGDEP